MSASIFAAIQKRTSVTINSQFSLTSSSSLVLFRLLIGTATSVRLRKCRFAHSMTLTY